MDHTWTVVGFGGSPRVPSSEISGEEDQVSPCEQLDALSLVNPLNEMHKKKRKENPWTDPIISALSSLIFPSGTFVGVYFSKELKFAIKLGYTVLLLKGYLFEKGSSQKFFLEVKGEGALVLHMVLAYSRFPKMKKLSSNWPELVSEFESYIPSSGIPPAGDITRVLLDIALKNLFDSQFPKRFPGIAFHRFVNEVYIFIRKNEKVLFDDKAGYALLEELGLRGKIESIGPGDDPLPP
ncbi:hypothetical protein FXO37_03585 [Capsicum annuum]|nr:hypothetical protein FXO37_03585 [Capsicum annuum]